MVQISRGNAAERRPVEVGAFKVSHGVSGQASTCQGDEPARVSGQDGGTKNIMQRATNHFGNIIKFILK